MASERVIEVLRAAEATLRDVERRLASLRAQQEWSAEITALLDRMHTSLSGLLEAVADPRYFTFFDAASADEFSRQANSLLGYFSSYPNDATNIAPLGWQHLATLGTIVRSSFIGTFASPGAGASTAFAQTDAVLERVHELSASLRQFQSQLSGLGTRQESLSMEIGEFLTKLQSQVLADGREREAEWRAQRKLEQEEFATALKLVGEARDAGQAEIRKALATFSTDSTSALDALASAKGSTLEKLTKYEADAAAALGAVGATAQSAGFERTASEAGKRSVSWQTAAVVLMGLAISILVAFLGFAAWQGTTFDLTPASIATAVTKVALLALVGVLSRYCAAMADRARREHLWAQQRALELRALTPYLENFDPAKRPELRERLLEKYFGVGSTMLAEVATEGTPATATHDAAVQALKYLLDRVPPDAVGGVLSSLATRAPKKKKKTAPPSPT